MPISAVDAISPALQHTKKQLFQPFRLGQWTKLAVVGLLAGELGSGGGGFNGNLGNNFPRSGGSHHFLAQSLPPLPNFALYAGLIAVLVAAALLLGIIFLYVSSVMRFILFDSVLTQECRVSESWNRRQSPGLRYFVWKLLYLVVTVAFLLLLIGIPAAFAFAEGWFKQPREHLAPLILAGVVLFLIALIFCVIAAVVFVLTKDFVVPQMALEGIGPFEGWRRLWLMMSTQKGDYAIYVGMKAIMALVAAVVIGIVTVILALFFVVPAVALGVVGAIAGQSAGFTWNPYTVTLAVIVGCFSLFFFLYLVALVSVPVIVFFPAYSIYFFAGRYPALSAALYAPRVPDLTPGAAGHGEPPLSPAPATTG